MHDDVKKIKSEVARKWGVSISDVEGRSRRRMIVRARQEAMGRCRAETKCSYADIAMYFGGRHHSTVIHDVNFYRDNQGEF